MEKACKFNVPLQDFRVPRLYYGNHQVSFRSLQNVSHIVVIEANLLSTEFPGKRVEHCWSTTKLEATK
jgi:hypothetical protein